MSLSIGVTIIILVVILANLKNLLAVAQGTTEGSVSYSINKGMVKLVLFVVALCSTLFFVGWFAPFESVLFFGALAILIGFFIPKKPIEWAGKALMGAAFIAIALSAYNSGFGTAIKQNVNQVEQCFATGAGCEQLSSQSKHLKASVVIPSCFDGWSDVVHLKPSYGTVNWSWAVRAQFLFEGDWYNHEPHTHVDTDGFRFCAKTNNQVGKAMPLDWTR